MIDNPREKLVLPHYDMAIQQAIILSQQGNLDLIHICTILFSDIELLQGNPRGALLHSRHGAGIFKSSQDNLGIGSLGIARSYQLFDEHLSGHHATTEDISSEPRLLLPSGGFSSLEQAHQSFASLVAKSWPLLAAFALGKSTSEHLSQHNSTTSPSMMHRAERAVHLDLDLWANSLLSSKDLLGLQDTGYKLQSLKINWLTVRIRMTSSLWDTAANTSDGEGFQELMRHYQSLWGKNVEAMRYVVVSQSSYRL
ncbi:4'-phosphopantetheinyl transferase [Penicillium malachiteum]|uniref:4'-phosphopantetheinyl transferase n=1 Tax=Penicillium malachiteum TaxID=1324776 RepID=UPI0025496512|nr:4'-phosphopantetheinyl transferase [Penicillium malachiteum]KAJ5721366.1 4'-phosphopantetheinyl transferase [Penicillium malachiteum]